MEIATTHEEDPRDEPPEHRTSQRNVIDRSNSPLRSLAYAAVTGVVITAGGIRNHIGSLLTMGNSALPAQASLTGTPRSHTPSALSSPKEKIPTAPVRIIDAQQEEAILTAFHEHLFLQDAETLNGEFTFDLESYPPQEQDQILHAMEALMANNGFLFENIVMRCPTLCADLKAIEQQRLLLEREKVDGEMSTVEIGSTVRSVLLADDDPLKEKQTIPDIKRLLDQRSIDIKRQRATLKGSQNESDVQKYKELAAELVKIGAARMGLNDVNSRGRIRKEMHTQYVKDIQRAANAMEETYERSNPALITMALIIEGWRQEHDHNLQAKADIEVPKPSLVPSEQ